MGGCRLHPFGFVLSQSETANLPELDGGTEMKHSSSQELFFYWNRIRGARTAPERSEVDPAAIKKLLADTFMLEIDVERRFPFRLTGTRVNALFDTELKGYSFIELWCKEDRSLLTAILSGVVDGRCPAVIGAGAAPKGHEEVDTELLLLPLRHHGKTHARVLGHLSPARHASWFGLLPVDSLRFHSARMLHQSDTNILRYQAPLLKSVAPAFRQYAHLRVYSGGR
jgi:hypothetical protein